MTALQGRIVRPDGSVLPGRVLFGDRVISIEPNGIASTDLILPGFIDLQVNGHDEIDVMSAEPWALNTLAGRLAMQGTAAFLPTAITAPVDDIVRVHDAVKNAMVTQSRMDASGAPPEAIILGLHCEGPFISPIRRGVHPDHIMGFEGPGFDRVLRFDHLRLITLAPELPGALAAIRRLTARGCVVSLGHSDSSLEQAQAAIEAGGSLLTHLFNAMRPLHHREPGIVTAGLLDPRVMVALIPDGVHLHPAILNLVYRLKGAGAIILTTDRAAAARDGTEAGNGTWRTGVRIEAGAARRDDGTLAGGTISMLDGLRRMVAETGATLGEAALMCATNAARLLGLRDRGAIAPGMIADLILLDRSLGLKAIFVGGRQAM